MADGPVTMDDNGGVRGRNPGGPLNIHGGGTSLTRLTDPNDLKYDAFVKTLKTLTVTIGAAVTATVNNPTDITFSCIEKDPDVGLRSFQIIFRKGQSTPIVKVTEAIAPVNEGTHDYKAANDAMIMRIESGDLDLTPAGDSVKVRIDFNP